MTDSMLTEILDEARLAIRLGWVEQAETILDGLEAGVGRDRCAEVFNLVGIVHERRGDERGARRWYGRSVRANPRYNPAHENLRRLFEQSCIGYTELRPCLGDERPALGMLLVEAGKWR